MIDKQCRYWYNSYVELIPELAPNPNVKLDVKDIEQTRKRLARVIVAVARYEQDPAIRDKPSQG